MNQPPDQSTHEVLLAYSADMLSPLFDRMPMGVVITDAQFRLLRYNATWVSFFDLYSPETAALIRPGVDYFDLLPEARSVLEPLYNRALRGEPAHETALEITTAGNTSYWDIVAAPLFHEQQVMGLLIVGTDVTAQVNTRRALQVALDELQLSHEAIEQRVIERTRELTTLMTVQQALTSSLNFDEVLQVIAREARRLTQTQICAVFLPQGEELVLAALNSEYPIDIPTGYQISLTESITGTTFATGRTQLITDVPRHAHVDPNATQKARLENLLSVPLLSGARIIGVMSVGNKIDGVLGAEDERLLTMMVPAVVIALENVRRYEQASETAVAAERGRLARDLHDSVTQTLFSASLTAEVLPRIWARNPEEGMIRLEKLRELTRGALAEMRTLLLELRPAALTEMPLADLLRQLSEGIAGRSRIDIKVVVTGDYDPLPDVKIALYRIAQEALNNVARHAKARCARVTLDQTGPQVALTIQDDGTGFDQTLNRGNHLGLRIMAERAEAIKAQLSVETQAGQGTQIRVCWSQQEL